MPLFHYESFNRRGARVQGTLDSPSLQLAKETLQGQGLMPTKIAEVSGEPTGFSLQAMLEGPVKQKTMILFTKQLTVLLKSSIPLLQALELLIEQFEGRFRRVIVSVKDGLKAGEPFAKELGRYPRIFPNVYVQLVKAGEASGKIDMILGRLTEFLEKEEETKKRISKAMAYPMVMLAVAGLVVVGLLVGLVPKMKSLFAMGGKALPGPTQILVVCSDAVQHHFVLMLCLVFGPIGFFMYWKRTPSGKYHIDNLLLKLPMTAYFTRTRAVVQFSKTLGMLLESGVNLSEALEIVCNIVDNRVLTAKLKEAQDKIIKEGKIARYLKETGIFPSIASYMISTGEQSGKLAEMLLTVGSDYEIELRELTDGLVAKIGPAMTLVMVGIIGFIILAIFLPILEMGNLAG